MIARAYLKDTPDPATEATKTDNDAGTTTRLNGIVNGFVKRQLDAAAMYADAIEPIGLEEVAEFLTHAAPYRYAGRGHAQMTIHGHEIADYETLRTEIDGRRLFLTLYRDASGKVVYIESTN